MEIAGMGIKYRDMLLESIQMSIGDTLDNPESVGNAFMRKIASGVGIDILKKI